MNNQQGIKIEINDKSFDMLIPPPGNHDSFFIFSLHKAGSTLLNNIINILCNINEIPYINFPTQFFSKGLQIENHAHELLPHFKPKGYCYGGYRFVPTAFNEIDLSAYPKVVLVRDPRDMVVSLYFSIIKSHVLPKEGPRRSKFLEHREKLQKIDINDYVLEVAPNRLKLMENLQSLGEENIKLYRYEDVIFDKKKWIKNIASYLKLSVNGAQLNNILERVDVIPKQENEGLHIRQVTPGDHRRKLRPETISKLTEIFKHQLSKYGYE